MAKQTTTEEIEALKKEYKKLSKRADQRLVRLEAYQHDKYYENVLKWSYAGAMKSIEEMGGRKRFNIKIDTDNPAEIKKRIRAVKSFLDKPTSTKAQINKIYKERVESYNKTNETNFTWEDFAEFQAKGTAEKLDAKHGYRTKNEAVAEIQKSDKELLNTIKKSDEELLNAIKNKKQTYTDENGKQIEIPEKIANDEILRSTIKNILNDSDIDISMLIKK